MGRSTDPAIQELLDKQALLEVVTRYCRAVDRCDAELLLSVYHEDAWDDRGTFKGRPTEFLARLQELMMNQEKTPGPVQHTITNALFEVDGDVAYGETYVEARVVQHGEVERGMARYVDRFERRNNEWRIAHRRVILEKARPGGVSDFLGGSRDRSDPSYERLTRSTAANRSDDRECSRIAYFRLRCRSPARRALDTSISAFVRAGRKIMPTSFAADKRRVLRMKSIGIVERAQG